MFEQRSPRASDRAGMAYGDSPRASSVAPSEDEGTPGGASDFIEHEVSRFDTLAGLAIKYRVSVADIKRANGLLSDTAMHARGWLRIPTRPLPVGAEYSSWANLICSSHAGGEEARGNAAKALDAAAGLVSSASSPTQSPTRLGVTGQGAAAGWAGPGGRANAFFASGRDAGAGAGAGEGWDGAASAPSGSGQGRSAAPAPRQSAGSRLSRGWDAPEARFALDDDDDGGGGDEGGGARGGSGSSLPDWLNAPPPPGSRQAVAYPQGGVPPPRLPPRSSAAGRGPYGPHPAPLSAAAIRPGLAAPSADAAGGARGFGPSPGSRRADPSGPASAASSSRAVGGSSDSEEDVCHLLAAAGLAGSGGTAPSVVAARRRAAAAAAAPGERPEVELSDLKAVGGGARGEEDSEGVFGAGYGSASASAPRPNGSAHAVPLFPPHGSSAHAAAEASARSMGSSTRSVDGSRASSARAEPSDAWIEGGLTPRGPGLSAALSASLARTPATLPPVAPHPHGGGGGSGGGGAGAGSIGADPNGSCPPSGRRPAGAPAPPSSGSSPNGPPSAASASASSPASLDALGLGPQALPGGAAAAAIAAVASMPAAELRALAGLAARGPADVEFSGGRGVPGAIEEPLRRRHWADARFGEDAGAGDPGHWAPPPAGDAAGAGGGGALTSASSASSDAGNLSRPPSLTASAAAARVRARAAALAAASRGGGGPFPGAGAPGATASPFAAAPTASLPAAFASSSSSSFASPGPGASSACAPPAPAFGGGSGGLSPAASAPHRPLSASRVAAALADRLRRAAAPAIDLVGGAGTSAALGPILAPPKPRAGEAEFGRHAKKA